MIKELPLTLQFVYIAWQWPGFRQAVRAFAYEAVHMDSEAIDNLAMGVELNDLVFVKSIVCVRGRP